MITRRTIAFGQQYRCCLIRFAVLFLTATLVAACLGSYGQYWLSRDVAKMFESLQLPGEYKYYYAGSSKNPDALMGLHRDYILDNDLWQETDMNSQQLKKWIDEINLVGPASSADGYHIMDPNGKQIGVFYSRRRGGAIKMESGNRVVIHLPDNEGIKRPMMLP